MGTAVVTGAGRGIGYAVARRFASDGYEVVCVDRDPGVEAVAAELGGRAWVGDVRDEALAAELAAAVDRCDALVNNAGAWDYTTITDTTVEAALEVLHVHVVASLVWTRTLAPVMAANGGGSVVNISSVAARMNNRGVGLYPVAKSAVVSLTKVAAMEYAASGVRVNAVGPGYILTEGTSGRFGADPGTVNAPGAASGAGGTDGAGTTGAGAAPSAPGGDQRASLVPLGRMGTPDDVAGAVAFLCSPDAAYITGDVVWVDGGIAEAANELAHRARAARPS